MNWRGPYCGTEPACKRLPAIEGEKAMDIGQLKSFLLHCLALSYAILMVWFIAFVFAHDAIHRLHTRWFRLSVEAFDAINYAGMALCKIGALLMFAVPLLALWLMP
jgi:hypothetical protein